MNDLTREAIEELERLDAERTPGPWVLCYWPLPEPTHYIRQVPEDILSSQGGPVISAEADVRFLVELANAVPALIATAKRAQELEAEVERLRELLREWRYGTYAGGLYRRTDEALAATRPQAKDETSDG